ncbi:MAG: OmpA family protein [Desulfohalobiaceae bacterium]|nr:OmpA family protein [Desulfohalobiaceae bacterium]
MRGYCVWCLFLLLFVGGCCPSPNDPDNLFVLTADPDQSVGSISVKNEAGEQIMTKARQGAEVKDAFTAPAEPVILDQATIDRLFGDALSARPQPPQRFLLYFQDGTGDLTADSHKRFQEIMDQVQQHPPLLIRIIGHSDTVGNARENIRLGLQRAMAVKRLLLFHELDPNRIETQSQGEQNLLVPTDNEVAEPQNRGVEVYLY